jgi:ABC-type branched-subunit amino acid transport system substrate-binding protein
LILLGLILWIFPFENAPAQNAGGPDEEFRVALLIPLSLEAVNDSLWRQEMDPVKSGEIPSFRFLQFYQGFMMAADSLERTGLRVRIQVYDVDQVPAKLDAALDDPGMREADLIVGPFYRNSFSKAAAFAREQRIPIVNPLSTRSDILLDNPFVVKVTPAGNSQPEVVSDLVRRDFRGHRVIIYVANKLQGSDYVMSLRQSLESRGNGSKYPVAVADYGTDSIQAFYDYAVKDEPNLVVMYSESEALPAALLGKINAMRNDYAITVIGVPDWDRFTNLESPYLMNLSAHALTASFVDYSDPATSSFIVRYRERFLDEPQAYAFSGFDIGYFFFGAMMRYGRDFFSQAENYRSRLIQNEMILRRSTPGSGFENQSWRIVKYEDYRMVDRSLFPE